MLDRLKDYDWGCAFQCAGETVSEDARWDGVNPTSQFNTASVSPVLNSGCDTAPFTREDVAEILAIADGENDGPNWIGLFKLKDGRYAYLTAGCDYTGWDCQSGGNAWVDTDLARMLELGIDNELRERCAEDLAKLG